MDSPSDKPFDPETWLNLWFKPVADMWNAPPNPDSAGPRETNTATHQAGRAGEWLESQFQIWQSLGSLISHPDTLSAGFQAISNLPSSLTSLILPLLTAAADVHLKTMNQTGKAVEFWAAFDFENPDQHAIELWHRLYDQEFQKFTKIPPIGITRQYQEKINRLMDRHHVLQTALADFLRLLYLPFEKAHADYAKKLAENAEKSELPKDAKSQYMAWLKILEGHYMVLFKTPEYLESLRKTINAATEYSLAKKAVTDDVLKALSIPSADDLEGVHRELHDMKQRLKALEKIMQKVTP